MDKFIVELINTGSELMLGFVLNTHQQWLCRRLAEIGYPVTRQVAVADTADAIRDAVQTALNRADIIVVTGGLGPTADDLTRPLIAELAGTQLREDAMVLAHIERFFVARNRPMPPRTRVQAMVPDGAIVVPNFHGTAPGLLMEVSLGLGRGRQAPALLIMLPGPPRELQPMFAGQVVPMLQSKRPLPFPFVCWTIKTTGLGESLIEDRIAAPLRHLVSEGLDLGYCARIGEVDVRISASGVRAEKMVAEAAEIVRKAIDRHIFGAGEDLIESIVVASLTERKQTLALAESCTGGFIANRITNVPGASAVFLGGFVTYSNEAKQQFLGVRPETLAEFGAVSEQTAREMAEGARVRTGATYAIAVTGIAGPAGGTDDKPAGTVYLALARLDAATTVLRQLNPYDRETFKFVTSQQALELLRRTTLRS